MEITAPVRLDVLLVIAQPGHSSLDSDMSKKLNSNQLNLTSKLVVLQGLIGKN